MEEQNFDVVTHREGTMRTDPSIEAIVTRMGIQSFNDRELGAVAAVVEKVAGKITKEKLNWKEGSSVKFQENQRVNAEALLAACVKLVNGNGDDGEIKVKVKAKF